MAPRIHVPALVAVLLVAVPLVLAVLSPAGPASAAGAHRPSVTGLSPARAEAGGGTQVTVSGRDFDGPTRVLFGRTPGGRVRVLSSRRLTVTAPRHGTGVVGLTVLTRHGRSVPRRFLFGAPLPVSALRVVALDSTRQTLSWRDPSDAAFSSVVVRTAAGTTAPATPTSGTGVPVRPGRVGSVTVSGLTPLTAYAYAVFARDRDGRYSPAVRASATTPDCAPARRQVPGTLTADTTLSAHCVSAWVLAGSLDVPAGVTLTLQPGVTIEAAPGAGLTVDGSVQSQGTAAAPVTLTSTSADPASGATPRAGDWAGITVDDTGVADLSATTLRYASTALEVAAGAQVTVRGAILDSTTGIDSPVAVVDARHVDWGDPSGPGPNGSGTPVTGAGVFATPWTGFALPSRPAPTPTNDVPPSDTTCADVLFIGARGSGEAPQGDEVTDPATSDEALLGKEVDAVYQTMQSHLDPSTTVRLVGLRYAAAPPPGPAFSSFSQSFYDDVWAGVDQLEATLRTEHARCPSEQIVLSGYSQGALVVHLALAELAAQQVSYPIAAVELVADPARTSTDADVRFGAAPTNSAGVWTVAVQDVALPPAVAAVTGEICHANDAVCDTATPAGADWQLNPDADGADHASYPVGDELDQLGAHAAQRVG